jgi:CheY-like chemotaxis protein
VRLGCIYSLRVMHTRLMHNFQGRQNLPTLLLIDDDLVSREVTATILTLDGYTVHTANEGSEALEMLADGVCEPQAILMDAQMPGLSGTALIQELRKHTKVHIYAISGSNAPDEVAAAADGFLLKPFSSDALKKLMDGDPLAPSRPMPSHLEPNESIVDAETLAQFRGMMPPAAVREIYTAVVNDMEHRIRSLEAAIAQGDDVEIRRLGHAIKGGCGMAGAVQAARLGALFEETPEGNQLDNRLALLRDLRAATGNLKRMLETEI